MTMKITAIPELEALLLSLIKAGSLEDAECVVAPETVPFKDIEGFDSLTALEVLTELEEVAGLHVEVEIFFSDEKKKYLSVRELALAIWKEMQKGGKIYA